MRQLTIAELFERNHSRLELDWVCGTPERTITVSRDDVSPADLIGYLNLIHPGRLQIFGAAEIAWSNEQTQESLAACLHKLLAEKPPALIVADAAPVLPIIRTLCVATDTPLLTTPQPAAAVIGYLRVYLARQLARTTTLHGVFMDVLGMGVIITGDSGVGKSELALELISRGHGLVADDVVEVARISSGILEGRCPELLRDFIEVRGLGLLNIRTVFGETACRRKMLMKLIVHLQRPQVGLEVQRLPLDAQTEMILDVPIHKVILPVAAGRNLAVLLETAVRSTILQLRGIDSMQEFLGRQQHALESGDKPDHAC